MKTRAITSFLSPLRSPELHRACVESAVAHELGHSTIVLGRIDDACVILLEDAYQALVANLRDGHQRPCDLRDLECATEVGCLSVSLGAHAEVHLPLIANPAAIADHELLVALRAGDGIKAQA